MVVNPFKALLLVDVFRGSFGARVIASIRIFPCACPNPFHQHQAMQGYGTLMPPDAHLQYLGMDNDTTMIGQPEHTPPC